MKQLCIVLTLCVLIPLLTPRVMPADEGQWHRLFNGRNLSGWYAVPASTAGDWSVKDGTIVGSGSEDRLSYLVWNNDELADFEFTLRYRLHGRGNSGIEIRAVPAPSERRPLIGYPADLGHVGIGPHILGAWDFHFAGREEPACRRGTRLTIAADGKFERKKISNPLPLSAIHQEGWNHVRIVAQGNRCAFYLNGKLSAAFCDQAAGSAFQAGSIGLQIHDAGTRIEFKDIQLRLMPAGKKAEN